MSLFIASLNSGSNGNCYYVGNERDAVLIDAGISCRETEKRMTELGLSLDKVRAIFISHEHSDHIKGLAVLSRKYHLPVYISEKTLSNSSLILLPELVRLFTVNSMTLVAGLKVLSFSKLHDAADPCSFTVEGNGVTVGIFTDLGAVCDKLTHYFNQCHAAFLEANYDEQMLENGQYPYHLKKRIRGGKGHLSNTQALNLFRQYKSPRLTNLLLAHLSHENNCPELTAQLFAEHAAGVSIAVASRHAASAVYHIQANTHHTLTCSSSNKTTTQLALF